MSTGVIITIIICSTVIILSGLNVLTKWIEYKNQVCPDTQLFSRFKAKEDEEC